MYVLIEGERYDLDLLNHIFSDRSFFDTDGTINSVGYYHSFDNNTLVFMLPKVFMKDKYQTVFQNNPFNLSTLLVNKSIKHNEEHRWIRELSFYFYKSLIEYKKRNPKSTIVYNSETFELKKNKRLKSYSYLDLVNSFIQFYKLNKNYLIHKKIEFTSSSAKNTNWNKTIRKSNPIHSEGNDPVYIQLVNRKKVVNYEEELLSYFMSILYHFDKEHFLNIKVDKEYKLIKGEAFKALCINGLIKLRKIKYRYFSDTNKRIYELCEIFFSKFDKSSVKRKKEDFLTVKSYNIVFEDMVDKLLSDDENYLIDNKTIKQLKSNDDGKIIDHMYADQSLLDDSKVFYIGDAKYYKSDNKAGRLSIYKQFTYAKNIIQLNINNLNKYNAKKVKPFVYREDITNGYNISPNYFLFGFIPEANIYNNPFISKIGKTLKAYHFKDRLFDRDSLFVQQYKINYLFVLKAYVENNSSKINIFKLNVKSRIRKNYINYFNDVQQSGYTFYEFNRDDMDKKEFVISNFYVLTGKVYITTNNNLILALKNGDTTLDHLIDNFQLIKFQDIN